MLQPPARSATPMRGPLANGSTLTVTRTCSARGGGAGGKAVLVQAFVDGRWTTVDSISANSRGTASWSYRFRATTRPTKYRFSVRVERAGDVVAVADDDLRAAQRRRASWQERREGCSLAVRR